MSRNAIPWRTIGGRGATVMPLLDTHTMNRFVRRSRSNVDVAELQRERRT